MRESPADPIGSDDERLRPYVAGLSLSWLRDMPDTTWQTVTGSLAFVDISGFTRLTERLAARGKAGAEELSSILDATFTELLTVGYSYGAQLVKWGGDAVLLLFTGDGHAARSCRAAHGMRRTMTRIGRLRTSAGVVTLRMSVGIHSGDFHFFLVGTSHRELLVSGPGATIAAQAEGVAVAGEIVVSAATAALLPRGCVGEPREGGTRDDLYVLAHAPAATLVGPPPTVAMRPGDAGRCLPALLRDHLLAGGTDGEHRLVGVAFVEFSGVDMLLDTQGPAAVAAALHDVIAVTQRACDRSGVTFWETDISPDGGKIMLVAGAPRSTDDDVGTLLGVVTHIVAAGGPLALRVGVNDGRVFFGGFGPQYRRTYSVKGDAVNLAARVMGKASYGDVWATESALDNAQLAFDAVRLAPFAAKGKSLPVQAYRIGTLAASGVRRPDDDLPIIGRERELSVLAGALAKARAGLGQLVEVVGEPGIGKSRLLYELRQRSDDVRAVTVACDSYHSATPYSPFRSLLRLLLNIPHEDHPVAAGAALTDSVTRLAPHLTDWLPLLAVVADATVPPTAATNALGDAFRKQRLESATVELLQVLLPAPTLLVVEDVHLIDVASAELLSSLCGTVLSQPWLLVVTRRTSRGAYTPVEDEHARIDLVPLDDVSARAVLGIASDESPLRPHELAHLADRAQGNPLFLLQLLHAARRTGSVEHLPDSVEGVVTSLIDQLPPVDRRLLRAAAVLGVRFSEDVLAALVEAPPGGLTLQRFGEFLERGDGMVAFRHALVRDAAYEGLPFSRRRELHARAGDLIEESSAGRAAERADQLSLHFVNAERYDKAWEYARIAGARAQEAYAYAEAVRFFGHAVTAARHLTQLPAAELARTWESLGDVRLRLGEFDAAAAAYSAARRGLRSAPLELARVQFRSAQAADLAADYPRALRWMTVARRTLASVSHEAKGATLLAEISGFYGLVRFRQGRETDAVRWCRRGVREAEAAGARRALASALASLDVAETVLGRGDGSNTLRALDIWRDLDDAWEEARAHNNLGIRAYYAGRWDEAVEHYDNAGEAASRAGDEWMATLASANVAEILLDQGRHAEAEERLVVVLRTFRATGARRVLSFGQGLHARLLARSGNFDEALTLYAAAAALQKADGEQTLVLETDIRVAECLVWQGLWGAALQSTGAAMTRVDAIPGASGFAPMAHRVRALALGGLGDLDGAVAAIDESIAIARDRNAPHEVAWSLDVLASLLDAVGTDPSVARVERDLLALRLGIKAFPHASGRRATPVFDDLTVVDVVR